MALCSRCTKRVEREAEHFHGSTEGPQKDGLRIGMLNVDGIRNKTGVITALIHSHQFDLFVVVETKLPKEFDKKLVSVDGYEVELQSRDKDGGGILVYIRKEITYSVDDKSLEKDKTQLMPIHIQGDSPIDLVAIYIPPKRSSKEKILEVLTLASNYCSNDNYIFLGDINRDALRYPDEFVEIESQFYLKQLITHPTHVTGAYATLLDHIYTNIEVRNDEIMKSSTLPKVVESGVIRCAISDHDVVYCTINTNKQGIFCKIFNPVIDSLKLKRDAEKSTSILELMRNIQNTVTTMGPVHGSYSSPKVPSDIWSEGLQKLQDARCTVIKSRVYEQLQTKLLVPTRDSYKAGSNDDLQSRIIPSYANCAQFLSQHSFPLLISPQPRTDSISQNEVKDGLKALNRWAFQVGHINDMQGLVDQWASDRSVLTNLRDIFNCIVNTPICTEIATLPAETSVERVIYDTFEYVLAARIPAKVQEESKADTLEKLYLMLTAALREEKSVLVLFIQVYSKENLLYTYLENDSILKDIKLSEQSVANVKNYLLLRDKRKVNFTESPILLQQLAKVRSELTSSESSWKVFGCGTEFALCIDIDINNQEVSQFPMPVVIPYFQNKGLSSRKYVVFTKTPPKDEVFNRKMRDHARRNEFGENVENVNFLGVELNVSKVKSQANENIVSRLIRLQNISEAFAAQLAANMLAVLKDYTLYICKYTKCKLTFETEAKRHDHYKSIHWVCPNCGATYPRESNNIAKQHMRDCTSSKGGMKNH